MGKRYSKIIKYDGKMFRYNYTNKAVEYIWILPEDDEILGWRKGEIDVIDSAGLQEKNWKDKATREYYLDVYSIDLGEEARYATD